MMSYHEVKMSTGCTVHGYSNLPLAEAGEQIAKGYQGKLVSVRHVTPQEVASWPQHNSRMGVEESVFGSGFGSCPGVMVR